MKNLILAFFFISGTLAGFGNDEIYSAAYGNAKDPAVIFLHGGPGYNSFSFEASTAKTLAAKGLYVIVYDQRGCGRSQKLQSNAAYTFKEAYDDLNGIYKKYKVKKAALIGHSFGGTLGIKFSQQYPKKVSHLILVGSPLSYQMTFKHIVARCKKTFSETDNQTELKTVKSLENSDTTSLGYSGGCFMLAMKHGFYSVANPSPESKTIKDSLKTNKNAAYLNDMTMAPTMGFYLNEKYTTLNLASDLKDLKGHVSLYGIYGKEDGLFDSEHLGKLQAIIGNESFTLVESASHNVFIDQRQVFVDRVSEIVLKK